MKTNVLRPILKAWLCLLVATPLAALPALRIETEPSRAAVRFLSWDTEGGGRANTNLLQAGTGVTLRVRDDGPGIPPNKLEQVFEAYYTSKDKGTGLGLSIVKHNVELYGGSVRAESELGKGARFVVLFPAKSLMKPAK